MDHRPIAQLFDAWAEAGRDESMERGHGDVVLQALERIAPGSERTLDLGCGNGWATRLFAAAQGASALGIDVAPAMAARARARTEADSRAHFAVMVFEALALKSGSFDRVFSMEALYYAVDLPAALAEAHRVLAPGGRFEAIVDFHGENPASERWQPELGLPMHYQGRTGWRAALETAGFTGVEFERLIDRRGPEPEARFRPSRWAHTYADHLAYHTAGSLWMRARRP